MGVPPNHLCFGVPYSRVPIGNPKAKPLQHILRRLQRPPSEGPNVSPTSASSNMGRKSTGIHTGNGGV